MIPTSQLLTQLTRENLSRRFRQLDLWFLAIAVLSAAIVLLMITPLYWMVNEAWSVEVDRAMDLLFSTQTGRVTANSLILLAAVTASSIVIGVPLALLTTRTDLPYPRFWTILVALPLVIPSYIGAIAFVGMFGSGGELDTLFGISVPRVEGLTGATFIITLYTYPYVFLTTRAALLSMDATLIDAARTLNTTPLSAFRRVTLPQIYPGIAAGALLAALYAISDFGTPAFMRADVFTSSIYWEFTTFGADYAALLSLQLVALVAVILVIEAGIGRDSDTRSTAQFGVPIRLGYRKWVAMGSMLVLSAVTLLAPIAIFFHWLLRSQADPIPSLEFQWVFALNSIQLATLAAIMAVLFALPVAYYSGRVNSVVSRILERSTYIGFAIPGIVIGLALVFLGTRTVPSLYREGVALLVFGYVIRFLPQAVGAMRASVLGIDDRMFEAARTLNVGRIGLFTKVTLPLITPGIVAGGILVFLTTMKELPITLLLQPIGMDTLVIIVWEAQASLAYRYAAIPALFLVLISGLTMIVLLYQEDSAISS